MILQSLAGLPAFLVYFFLAARAGTARAGLSMSLAELADRTGLSKRAVQLALAHLRRRHLLRTGRALLLATAHARRGQNHQNEFNSPHHSSNRSDRP